jgi:hypothetical protein
MEGSRNTARLAERCDVLNFSGLRGHRKDISDELPHQTGFEIEETKPLIQAIFKK